ncbi:MAG: biotin-dependent carboxyltransferase family protein [Nitrospirales bacterium]|nr:biotin-dependent carboxyltransferase family protein [Nitrospirales bacterium]QOJ34512.1 MAG: biotin-dependent carboxyltransferase [Nitrospira sp.]
MPANNPIIHVLRPGLLTTVQDLGRFGYQRFGVSVSGAMDRWALAVGNRLVGNPDHTAGLEITLQGPELLFEQTLAIAITGADLSPTCDGHPLPLWTRLTLPAGSRLQFGRRRHGARAYLTVRGGIESPLMLGSRSTHLRSGLGGPAGRALQKWDRLMVGKAGKRLGSLEGQSLPDFLRPSYSTAPTLRVIPGPQAECFPPETFRLLAEQPYRITADSDRMGYRLQGQALPPRDPTDIVSDAVTCGAIQVPADQQPILLMADCQPTGGYAKLATLAGIDRSLAAQVLPGDHLSFVVIRAHEAIVLARAAHAKLDRLLPAHNTPGGLAWF